MWIEIVRNGVKVYIMTDNYNRVRNIVTPYFECALVKNVKQIDNNSWKIVHEYKNNRNLIEINPYFHGDKEPKRVYCIDEEDKTIIIVQPCDKEFVLQISIRLARDIIKHTLLKKGYCYLHGGMVLYQNKGICFLGEKMHGKTSFLLSMLATKKADYVTNDDITINVSNNSIVGIGWPRAISVRKDSVQFMSQILHNYRFDIEFSHPDNYIDQLNDSYFYYVNDLINIFECKAIPYAKVDFFIYLQFTNGDFSVVEATEQEKISVMQRFVDSELSKYFMDFKKYFGKCENALPKEIAATIKPIPLYFVNQNIKKMEQVQEWIRKVINE